MSEEAIEPPFEAYRGSDPYVFISYSHSDSKLVYAEMQVLHDAGYRIWYDDGITPAENWPADLQGYLDRCSVFFVFITMNAVNSIYVQREILRAISQHKILLPVYLEQTKLPSGIELLIASVQSIFRYKLDIYRFLFKLQFVPMLSTCFFDYNNGNKHDIAISYVEEDSENITKLADLLANKGVSVCFDIFDNYPKNGLEIFVHLLRVYHDYATIELIFLSQSFISKVWTDQENVTALTKAFSLNQELILFASCDGTNLHLNHTFVRCQDLGGTTLDNLVISIMKKLNIIRKNQEQRFEIAEEAKSFFKKDDIEEISAQEIQKEYTIEKNSSVIEIWKSLAELKIATEDLWNSVNEENLTNFKKSYKSFRRSNELNAIFTWGDHYKILRKLLKVAANFLESKDMLNAIFEQHGKLDDSLIDRLTGIIEQNRILKDRIIGTINHILQEFKTILPETN